MAWPTAPDRIATVSGRSTPPDARPPPGRALRPALGVRRGDTARRFPASRPPRGRGRGYAGVHPLDAEDPPKMFAMLAACTALTLIAMSLAVPREVEARGRTAPRGSGEVGPGVGPPLVTRRPRPLASPRPHRDDGPRDRPSGSSSMPWRASWPCWSGPRPTTGSAGIDRRPAIGSGHDDLGRRPPGRGILPTQGTSSLLWRTRGDEHPRIAPFQFVLDGRGTPGDLFSVAQTRPLGSDRLSKARYTNFASALSRASDRRWGMSCTSG